MMCKECWRICILWLGVHWRIEAAPAVGHLPTQAADLVHSIAELGIELRNLSITRIRLCVLHMHWHRYICHTRRGPLASRSWRDVRWHSGCWEHRRERSMRRIVAWLGEAAVLRSRRCGRSVEHICPMRYHACIALWGRPPVRTHICKRARRERVGHAGGHVGGRVVWQRVAVTAMRMRKWGAWRHSLSSLEAS